MTCMASRHAMQTANRAELRAEGDSVLAAHLRECAACRMVAIRLEAGTDLLGEMVAARPAVPQLGDMPGHSRRRVRRAAGFLLVPIAAAAIGVFLLHSDGAEPVPLTTSDTLVATAVAVDVAKGQTATVIKTRDPNVTIIWLTPRGTE